MHLSRLVWTKWLNLDCIIKYVLLLELAVNCLIGRELWGPAERSLDNPLYSCIRECQLIAVCCRNYMFHQDMQALKCGATSNTLNRISATYHRMPAAGLIFACPHQVSSINGWLSCELVCEKCMTWTHREGDMCVQPHVSFPTLRHVFW